MTSNGKTPLNVCSDAITFTDPEIHNTTQPELRLFVIHGLPLPNSVVILYGDTTFLTDVMMEAHRKGMTSGDYVFINPNLIPDNDFEKNWEDIMSQKDVQRDTFWPFLQASQPL